MEAQNPDFGLLGLALQIEVSALYFDFKIRARLLVESWAILQVAERIKLWFKDWRFLIPKPPLFLSMQISTHALKQRYLKVLSSFIPVHQKSPNDSSDTSKQYFYNKIFDIKQTGIEEKNIFNKSKPSGVRRSVCLIRCKLGFKLVLHKWVSSSSILSRQDQRMS